MDLALKLAPFAFCAILAFASGGGRNRRLFAVTKPATTLALLVAAGVPRGGLATFTCVGLVLSAIGDAALLDDGPTAFVAGVFFFLLAHLAYALGFGASGGWGPTTAAFVGEAAVVVASTSALVASLWPGIERNLRAAVVVYGIAISAMVIAALRLGTGALPHEVTEFAIAGAIAFYASDAVLAWTRFRRHFSWEEPVNLALYWGGQLALALAARASELV